MTMTIDILSWILLTAGGVFVFIGGLGALRMPNGNITILRKYKTFPQYIRNKFI